MKSSIFMCALTASLIFARLSFGNNLIDYCAIKCSVNSGGTTHTLCKYADGPSKTCKKFTPKHFDENYQNELLQEINKVLLMDYNIKKILIFIKNYIPSVADKTGS